MKVNGFQKYTQKNLKFMCQESLQNKWQKWLQSLHFCAGPQANHMDAVIVSADIEWSGRYPGS